MSRSEPPAYPNDVMLACHAGADVIVVDGMVGGTAATQEVFMEPPASPPWPRYGKQQTLCEIDMDDKVQLVISGCIRSGADVATALALSADGSRSGWALSSRWDATRPR